MIKIDNINNNGTINAVEKAQDVVFNNTNVTISKDIQNKIKILESEIRKANIHKDSTSRNSLREQAIKLSKLLTISIAGSVGATALMTLLKGE